MLGMTSRQLALTAAVSVVVVASAILALVGLTDAAMALTVALIGGIAILLLDLRRRLGDVGKRLRAMSTRQDRVTTTVNRLPEAVADQVRRRTVGLKAVPATIDRRFADLSSAQAETFTAMQSSLGRARVDAAERHVEVMDLTREVAGLSRAGDDRAAGWAAERRHGEMELTQLLTKLAERESAHHESLLAFVRTLEYRPVQQLQSLAQLLRRLPEEAPPLPPVSGWALQPTTLLRLTWLVEQRGLNLVLECGSGASTLWLADTMRRRGRGRVVALEHEVDYAHRTRAVLADHGLSDYAEVRLAPLVNVTLDGAEYGWYDTTAIEDLRDIDLLLVDGPPKASGPNARYPGFPLVEDRLADRAWILVDDAHRPSERQTIAAWLESRDGALERELGSDDRSALLRYSRSG